VRCLFSRLIDSIPLSFSSPRFSFFVPFVSSTYSLVPAHSSLNPHPKLLVPAISQCPSQCHAIFYMLFWSCFSWSSSSNSCLRLGVSPPRPLVSQYLWSVFCLSFHPSPVTRQFKYAAKSFHPNITSHLMTIPTRESKRRIRATWSNRPPLC